MFASNAEWWILQSEPVNDGRREDACRRGCARVKFSMLQPANRCAKDAQDALAEQRLAHAYASCVVPPSLSDLRGEVVASTSGWSMAPDRQVADRRGG
jgi:hypothetical protein